MIAPTTRPLAADFRFYRVKLTGGSAISRETAGVFELSLEAEPKTKFIGVPLLPDPDHTGPREIFGEGSARQIARNSLQLSDLNEATGGISRLRYNVGGTFDLVAGSEFDIVQNGLSEVR